MKFTTFIITTLLATNAFAQEQEQTKLVDAEVPDNSGVQLDIEQVDDGQEDFTFNIIEREPIPVQAPIVVAKQPAQTLQSRVTLVGGSVSFPAKERNKWIGMTTSIGVPSLAQIGLSIRPGFQWAHLDVMANYALKLGYAASLTLDPINFPIAPTVTGEFGHVAQGKIPQQDVSIGWNYKQILGGLEFGNRRSFRFFLRAGVSWIDVKTQNVNSLVKNDDIVIGDPTLKARVTGTFKLGFNLFF